MIPFYILLACASAEEPSAAPALSVEQAAQLDEQAQEIAEIKTEVADLKVRIEAAFPAATAAAKSDALEPPKGGTPAIEIVPAPQPPPTVTPTPTVKP